jgi:hypothetical protein
MNWSTARDILEILQLLVIVVGAPWAYLQFIRERERDQVRRHDQSYEALDDRYSSWLEACLEHPNLDIFDVPDPTARTLNDVEKKEELILFTSLIAIFERAYFLVLSPSAKKLQTGRVSWVAWSDYIERYCQRPNFQTAWAKAGDTFSDEFRDFMGAKLAHAVAHAESN